MTERKTEDNEEGEEARRRTPSWFLNKLVREDKQNTVSEIVEVEVNDLEALMEEADHRVEDEEQLTPVGGQRERRGT